MPVLIKSLNPSVSRLNGELTTIALGLEHGLPVSFAVGFAILQVEGALADLASALDTEETLRVVGVLQGIHTLPHDGVATLLAARSEELLIVLLAKELALFLNEADSDERRLAIWVRAVEMVGAPGLVHGQHKGSSD